MVVVTVVYLVVGIIHLVLPPWPLPAASSALTAPVGPVSGRLYRRAAGIFPLRYRGADIYDSR